MLAKDIAVIYKRISKNLNKIQQEVKKSYAEDKINFKISIEGIEYDFREKLLDISVLNQPACDLISEKCKKFELEDLSTIDLDLVNNIQKSLMDTIRGFRKGEVGLLSRYDSEVLPISIVTTSILNIDIADILARAIYNSIFCGAIPEERLFLVPTYELDQYIILYIAINNGYLKYLEGVKNTAFSNIELSKNTEATNNDIITYENYTKWLDDIGINSKLLTSYIKNIVGCKERTKGGIKEYFTEVNKEAEEYLKSNNTTEETKQEIINNAVYRDRILKINEEIVDITNIVTFWKLDRPIINKIYNQDLDYILLLIEWLEVIFKDELNIQTPNTENLELGIWESMRMLVSNLNICIEKIGEKHNKSISDLEKLQAQLDQLKSTYKKCKSQLKQAKNDLVESQRQIETQKNKNEKQIKYIDSLKSQGIINVDGLKIEAAELRESLSKSEKDNDEQKRIIGKLRKQISENEEEIVQLKEVNNTLKVENEGLVERVKAISDTQSTSQIPIEIYVNAIQSKRIAIFGGDMMHAELRKLDFKNLKLFEASNRQSSFGDLAYQDLIVIVTGYIAHSTSYIPKGAAEKAGIPVLYFNKKNVTSLIQEMFKMIYSDNTKKISDSAKT